MREIISAHFFVFIFVCDLFKVDAHFVTLSQLFSKNEYKCSKIVFEVSRVLNLRSNFLRVTIWKTGTWLKVIWVGGNRSKERDRKSELVLGSTYQTFQWDRNNSDRNFYF